MSLEIRLKDELLNIIEAAHRISTEVGEEVKELLQAGLESPLSHEDAEAILTKVVERLQDGAKGRGDEVTAKALSGDVKRLVEQILEAKERVQSTFQKTHRTPMVRKHTVQLLEQHNGIPKASVVPRPIFHGREIPMMSGYVKMSDVQMWDQNKRLDIHVGQFRQNHGREPTPQELLDIMIGTLQLPGTEKIDQFKILELARSIAVNGVRKPPIIDVTGGLLDGNRRLAACNLIMNTDEFSADQKRRIEYLYVWQLTPDSTDDDRRRVMVSLNFEDDCKEPWPEYVKAREVYVDWQAILELESPKPGPRRQAEIKKEISKNYALGDKTDKVDRYIKMVEWSNDFVDYHIIQKGKDRFEAHHKAEKYFQYFDELRKGVRPGGVAYVLGQDENFKHLVFDLLFEDKFRNWRQLRDLKHIYENEEARDYMRRAAREPDLDEAHDLIRDAITVANTARPEKRALGANTRIEIFVKWLEEVPPRTFRDDIRPEMLRRLLNALQLVEPLVRESLEADGKVIGQT